MKTEVEATERGIDHNENKHLETSTMLQLQKDFQMIGMPLPQPLRGLILSDKWLVDFENYLHHVNNSQNRKLIQLLYRIDVSENVVMKLDDSQDGYRQLAKLIIKREQEKVAYRLSQNNLFK